MKKEEIIKLREGDLSIDKAEELQRQLIDIYKKEYKPKHDSGTYLKLILDEEVSEITERHSQDNNYTDTVYECFSVVSQHVYGFTKEHCLDQIYDAVKRREERIEYYKTLPTLEELVNSNMEIDPTKTYNTKEKGSYEDSCDGYSGDVILEMRDIGIKEYNLKRIEKFFDYILRMSEFED